MHGSISPDSPAIPAGSAKAATPLLTLQGIHKRFPGVHALRGVGLDVRPGEVHAVVGENGAGKSTLLQILAGVYQPDAGRIDLDGGQDVRFRDERAARDAGIALVFQERSLFGPMSVAENVFAARQPVRRWGHIDRAALAARAQALLDEVGLAVPPEALVETLSPAQQQLIEIAKALSLGPRLILFDEPTAVLTPAETERLFGLIRGLRARGAGVVYISHRLEEVFAIADRVTVLKDGAGQGTFATAELTPARLVALMVGREVNPHTPRPDPPPADSPVVLEVADLSDGEGVGGLRPRLCDINLKARAGEVVGLAGLVGAGRTELALALFGARRGVTGQVRVAGRPVALGSPADAIAAGIGYLPEDRKEAGLFPAMSVEDNVSAVAARGFGSWWYSRRRQREAVVDLCRALRVVCRGPAEVVQNLSGGNQQKVVLARWLLARPRVLIVDEPTRGVDVGAKAEIHNLLYGLAREGTAVLVISSDLPEVLAVSDRVVVLREGKITGELPRGQATEPAVMNLASLGKGADHDDRRPARPAGPRPVPGDRPPPGPVPGGDRLRHPVPDLVLFPRQLAGCPQ
jgi:ABC-type sugar transport system ATPase subunit